jgi:hypothetical protein
VEMTRRTIVKGIIYLLVCFLLMFPEVQALSREEKSDTFSRIKKEPPVASSSNPKAWDPDTATGETPEDAYAPGTFNLFSEVKKHLRKNDKLSEVVDLLLPDISMMLRYTFNWPRGKSFKKIRNKVNRLYVWIDKSYLDDKFGYHVNFQYMPGKKGKYPREVWLEEAYGYLNTPLGKIKAGIVYTPFGLLWEHTFFGSAAYRKGYMADEDYGAVIEKKIVLTERFEITPSFGYFLKSDGLNGATALGTGIEYLKGGEKNTFSGRLVSTLKFNDDSSISLGGSALTGEVRHPDVNRQTAYEADLVYCLGPLTLTSEYIYYDQNYPKKDPFARGQILVLEANLEAYRNDKASLFKGVILNYNFSEDLPKKGNGYGRAHLPSVCVELTDEFKMELNYLYRKSGQVVKNESWWLILYLSF